ncbi:class I SAM-dependent methyltransferase [Amycolatopsis cynarae]|uniref:Class I SAM-dependent methyltransferase n=1 Tax=Amycolatopsis cynarae TaxID=2995223 RepID=A0ABY7B1A0_9PSEU|nr:class I SAM-dependent methyltransferase [Amycolatopsis sp. HUAS 11-8]WAL65712.1 class I SAM-dependent methyltransferase [Amycolatopsis sp. HUAS 11-8]
MITADGCPVEVYTMLPAAGEAEIVHAAISAGATVLDLGCGTGRIAHRLVELGHPVTAVDDSPEMLAHLRGAEKVCARIEDLRLGRGFDAVLLASHLINGSGIRGLLAAVRRHLSDDGRALIEWHPPEWFDRLAEGDGGMLGEVRVSLRDIVRRNEALTATVRYEARGGRWEQRFTAYRLTEANLVSHLAEAGLAFEGWRDPERTWFGVVSV